jgi:hypothetical protein
MANPTQRLTRRVFLIDTSYLVELFKVPGCSTPQARFEIEQRYNQALADKNELVVPLPCIFELSNHIAQVSNGYYRREVARVLWEIIENSVREEEPWTITPAMGIETLPVLFEEFVNNYVSQQIGLVDTFIIQEAWRLKTVNKKIGCQVHIWTKDQALKAYEPDV